VLLLLLYHIPLAHLAVTLLQQLFQQYHQQRLPLLLVLLPHLQPLALGRTPAAPQELAAQLNVVLILPQLLLLL
jgi:hypothetical protein